MLRLEKGHFDFFVSVKKEKSPNTKYRLINSRKRKNVRCAINGIRIKQTKQCVGIKTVVD